MADLVEMVLSSKKKNINQFQIKSKQSPKNYTKG